MSIELADLRPNLTLKETAAFLGVAETAVGQGFRAYVARMEAIMAITGERVPHDSEDALPLPHEYPGRYTTRSTMGRDRRRHGGAPRIYRDLLLWREYGVRDYGHRPCDKVKAVAV